jgi:hypothetical protein
MTSTVARRPHAGADVDRYTPNAILAACRSRSSNAALAAVPRTVVAVIGSGRSADAHPFFETSPRRGIVIGVVPGLVAGLDALEERIAGTPGYDMPPGYPNEWVELAIYTHLPDSGTDGTLASSRNPINVLSADAIVALPGREGTESEVWLATQYGVPIVAYGPHAPHGIHHAETLDEIREFLVRSLPSSTASP